MEYKITLNLEEKAMIETAIKLSLIALANSEDQYDKTKLAEYKKLLKKVQELKSIG